MDIADIRAKLTAGRYEFSRHAFERSVERNISKEDIRQAGSRAEVIEDYPDDKYSPSCLVAGFTDGNRALHMQVCYTYFKKLKIITIYEPEVEQWDNFLIRKN